MLDKTLLAARAADPFSWSANGTPSAFQLLHLVQFNERGRPVDSITVTATLLLANCAAWHLELMQILHATQPWGRKDEVLKRDLYLPASYLLPGLAAALEHWGLGLHRIIHNQREVKGFSVTEVERTFAISLTRPGALSTTALHQRSLVAPPNLIAAVGVCMRDLGMNKVASRLALLCKGFIEVQLQAWVPALEAVGLDSEKLSDHIAELAFTTDGGRPQPAIAAHTDAMPKPRSKKHICSRAVNSEALLHAAKSLPSDRGRWGETMKEFAEKGGVIHQRLLTATEVSACEALRLRYPNFGEAIDVIVQRLQLQRHCRLPAKLPTLCLVGPPGTGKSSFARAVADALGGRTCLLPLEQTTGSFSISGCHPSWSSARPGEMAQLLLKRGHEGPDVVVLDEIDKCHTGVHPVEPALLGLLDSASVKRFRDEFLQLEMDLSSLSFIATANDLTQISAPLRSRLQLIHVPLPTPEQMPAIAQSVDEELRRDSEYLQRGFGLTPIAVYQAVACLPPRLLRRALECAYSLALNRNHRRRARPVLTSAEVEQACRLVNSDRAATNAPMGFIPGPSPV